MVALCTGDNEEMAWSTALDNGSSSTWVPTEFNHSSFVHLYMLRRLGAESSLLGRHDWTEVVSLRTPC